MRIDKEFYRKFGVFFKYLLYTLTILCIISIFTIIYQLNSIKSCDMEYAEIIEWGEYDDLYVYDDFLGIQYQRYLTYEINNIVYTLDIEESGNLSKIQEIYPVGNDYFFILCNDTIYSILRRDFLTENILYKLAEVI